MELRHLLYFVTVSRLGSYTKAAEALRVAQPSLSVAIRKLEEEVGLALLKRNNKQVLLTEGGKLFLHQAKKVLQAAEDLQRAMQTYKEQQSGTIQFAFPSNVGYWLWSALNQKFARQYPQVTIHKENGGTQELLRKLASGKFDLIYGVVDGVATDQFVCAPIKRGEMKLLIAKNHPFAKRKTVPLHLVAEENVIMYPQGTTLVEKLFSSELTKQQLTVRTSYVDERSIVYDLVSQNLGVSVVLDDSMPLLLNNSNLLSRSFAQPIYFTSGLIWRREGKLSPGAHVLVDFIKNYQNLG